MTHTLLHRSLIGRTHIGALAAVAAMSIEEPLVHVNLMAPSADPRKPTSVPPGDLSDAVGTHEDPMEDADDEDGEYDDGDEEENGDFE